MNSLCEVALRTVMLGTAAGGDHPSIIAFIVFARRARALHDEPSSPEPAYASGRHPNARDMPRAASRTAGINAGTCAST